MTDPVKSVDVFTLTQSRDKPYLGDYGADEQPNKRGYFVRKANGTVYPIFDRSIVLRIETRSGIVGWGETYGIIAPGAVAAIINDLLADFTIGRDPSDPAALYDDLYDLMRVRGYTGGFYVDALCAIDIALWDIAGQQAREPIANLLGGSVDCKIPAYVSGLPESTLEKRGLLAKSWQKRGFNAFKFATPVADEGADVEIEHLRKVLGPTAQIAADMHWNQSAEQAISLIRDMEPHDLWFAEAPVRTENIAGLEQVAAAVDTPIAVGEEWRTHYDLLNRIERCKVAIVQPEMGHKGITGFMRIGRLAEQHQIEVMPHATIGAGIFLAASLQASASLATVSAHEFQHSIFEPNRSLLSGNMDCQDGYYSLPSGYGLGVEPSQTALNLLQPL
jgi:L-alanine-DL-glutamate epimerase-like enolase superfamily enzyme